MGQKGHSDVRPRPGWGDLVIWEAGRNQAALHTVAGFTGVGRLVGKRVRSVIQKREGSKAAQRDAISMDECPHRHWLLPCTQVLARHGSSSENTYERLVWKMHERKDERIHCLNGACDFISLGLMFSHLEVEGVEAFLLLLLPGFPLC